MKRILLLFILWGTALLGYCAPIDLEQALKNAENFLINQKGIKSQVKLDLCYTGHSNSKSDNKELFYIFTSKESDAFVIASADDRISPILAYSTEGDFQLEDMPENLRSWLSFYEKNIPTLIENGEVTSHSKGKTKVLPLLKDIAWNQNSPFNDLAPGIGGGKKAAAGCVATAMTQIMRYHRWPDKATGEVSYSTRTLKIPLSQDLGDKPFDWNNMPGIYSSSSTTVQRAAVAQLIYYAGVSVEMDYNSTSGAYSSDVPNALINNFGYSVTAEMLYRDIFDYSNWANMIRLELDAGYPVYYSGASPGGGHAFVCDGYDENDLFHINWGWGGVSNGYFSLLQMNPSEQGIGAGSGGGYINGQGIIIGIKPPKDGDTPSEPYFAFEQIGTGEVQQVDKTDPVTINIDNIFNYGSSNFIGSLGLALYNVNGDFNSLLTEHYDLNIKPYYGWYNYSFGAKFSNAPVGKYHLRPVSKPQNSEEWEICKYINTISGYVEVEITETKVIFSFSSYPTLALEGDLSAPVKIYAGKRANFSMIIKNNGTSEYSSNIGLRITEGSEANIVVTNKIIIPAGATQAVQFSVESVSSRAGEVTLDVLYDAYNGSNEEEPFAGTLASKQLTIHASTSEMGSVPTVESFTIDKSTFEVGETFTLNASLKSTDNTNHFEAPIIIFVFKSGGGSSVGYVNYDNTFSLAPNETKNLIVPGSLYLNPGNYLFAFFYDDPTEGWTQFSNKFVEFTLNKHYTLTYTAGADGTLTGETTQTVKEGSDATTVTAVPNTGYKFVQWSDGLTDNPRTDINVTTDITVKAEFIEEDTPVYTLTYTAGENGYVSGITTQTVAQGASGTAIIAMPNTGYYFVQWSDGVTDNPRTDTNITTNITVEAEFDAPTYTLTFEIVNANETPIEGATITINEQNLTSSSDGKAEINLTNGTYHYSIALDNYNAISDQVTISDEDKTLKLTMIRLSLDENLLSDVNLYPNPATNIISVDGLISDKCSIQLIDIQGRIVLKQRIENNKPISINQLGKGVYIAVISDKNSNIIKRTKIIKH